MSSVQEGSDCLAVCAGSQLLIVQATRQVLCRVHIGMSGVPADHTTERLLVRTVLAGDMVTVMAFLGTVGALDLAGTDASLGCTPVQLRRDVSQIGSVQIRIHLTRL